MKILYHHRIRSRDGQFVHVSEIIKAMRALGHEVVLIGPEILDNAAEGLGAGWVARFKRLAPAFVYEFVEMTYSIYDFPRLVFAVRRHHPDFIYERYNLFFFSGVWASFLCRLPLLLEVNAPLAQERAKFGGLALKRLASWSEAYVWRRATRVLPVTRVLGKIIEAAGADPNRIEVISNGVDPATFTPDQPKWDSPESRNATDSITVGFVGYLRKWHQLDRVISLLSQDRDRNTRLIVIGEGPAQQELLATAEAQGVQDRVHFVGVKDRADLPRHICRFDIALQPSVVDYASPLKLQEYMAMVCAIVAPDKENIREVLVHEHNALLFDPECGDSFESAVHRLCTDAELRQRLGLAATATIRDRGLTWDNNARRIVTIAEECLPQAS